MARRVGLVLVLGALVVAGAVFFKGTEEEAVAGFTSESTNELVALVTGKAPFNRKLMALEEIRARTESGIEAELEKIAKGKDKRIGVMACAALCRKGTTAAKGSLKSLLEDGTLDVSVRMGALSAIVFGWKSTSDQSYLASKTEGNAKLSAHYLRLRSKVYGN